MKYIVFLLTILIFGSISLANQKDLYFEADEQPYRWVQVRKGVWVQRHLKPFNTLDIEIDMKDVYARNKVHALDRLEELEDIKPKVSEKSWTLSQSHAMALEHLAELNQLDVATDKDFNDLSKKYQDNLNKFVFPIEASIKRLNRETIEVYDKIYQIKLVEFHGTTLEKLNKENEIKQVNQKIMNELINRGNNRLEKRHDKLLKEKEIINKILGMEEMQSVSESDVINKKQIK